MDMLRPKTDKVDSIQKKMGSVSSGKEILRRMKKEMLEIKDTKTKIKISWMGLFLDVHSSEKNLWTWGYPSINYTKTESKGNKRMEKQNKISINCEITIKDVTCA